MIISILVIMLGAYGLLTIVRLKHKCESILWLINNSERSSCDCSIFQKEVTKHLRRCPELWYYFNKLVTIKGRNNL